VAITLASNIGNDIVGNVHANVNSCHICNEDPCNWNLYGRAIVHSVRSSRSIDSVVSLSDNKSCRYNAYGMYARLKSGYLGKGNCKKLPSCVTDGIRANFPDPNDTYVGFVPSSLET
jgi:hypothetical protein